MILTMKRNALLRLERARGMTIEVVRGRAWMTEGGRKADTFLAPGQPFRVAGNGLVLISPAHGGMQETSLRLLLEPVRDRLGAAMQQLRALLRTVLYEWRVQRVTRMLAQLDDRALNDIGLRRANLEAAVRERLGA